jgi:hypothetical protein
MSSLSYHGDPTRWRPAEDHRFLKTVGKGQEFVLNTEPYPERLPWALASLFGQGSRDRPEVKRPCRGVFTANI